MMKWFRKHNKMLLAVFMVLLMIVFVGGTALQEILMPLEVPAMIRCRLRWIIGNKRHLLRLRRFA